MYTGKKKSAKKILYNSNYFWKQPKEIFRSLLDTLKITDCSSFALVIDIIKFWKLIEKYEIKIQLIFLD